MALQSNWTECLIAGYNASTFMSVYSMSEIFTITFSTYIVMSLYVHETVWPASEIWWFTNIGHYANNVTKTIIGSMFEGSASESNDLLFRQVLRRKVFKVC